jgi:hypothetical protein
VNDLDVHWVYSGQQKRGGADQALAKRRNRRFEALADSSACFKALERRKWPLFIERLLGKAEQQTM